ncbi:MAG: hypothetical protein HQK91_05550 [Nitrospirae bacterium]|nr:hypothetical protein [Nitrospirota bacterium]
MLEKGLKGLNEYIAQKGPKIKEYAEDIGGYIQDVIEFDKNAVEALGRLNVLL